MMKKDEGWLSNASIVVAYTTQISQKEEST